MGLYHFISCAYSCYVSNLFIDTFHSVTDVGYINTTHYIIRKFFYRFHPCLAPKNIAVRTHAYLISLGSHILSDIT